MQQRMNRDRKIANCKYTQQQAGCPTGQKQESEHAGAIVCEFIEQIFQNDSDTSSVKLHLLGIQFANPPLERLHEYYTPKTHQKQVKLDIFTIFVDYAYFYVNIIMLTSATSEPQKQDIVQVILSNTLYIVLQAFLHFLRTGKLNLPVRNICTN